MSDRRWLRGDNSGGSMFDEEEAGGQEGGQATGGQEDVSGTADSDAGIGQDQNQQDDFDTRLDKHPRFQEVYQRMKDAETKLSELEKKSAPQNTEDPDLAELVKWGFDKEKAGALLRMLEARAERKILPLQERATSQEMDVNFRGFFQSHPEADKEVIAEMEKLYDGLQPTSKKAYALDLSSLDMLLAKAMQNLGRSYQKGKTDAISQAKRKKEGGSISGSPAGDIELTEESIAAMSPAEFKKREKEIMAKLREVEAESEE